MKLLTRDEAKDGCQDAGVGLSAGRHVFEGLPGFSIQLQTPSDYSHAVVFADSLLSFISSESENILLWIIDDVWDEQATTTLLNQIRSGAMGYPTELSAMPAQLLDSKEYDLTCSLFLICLLGRLDALLLPASGRFFFSLSHHGLVEMHSKDDSGLALITRYLKNAGISVQERSQPV